MGPEAGGGWTGPAGTVLRVFVKICGITDVADAIASVEAGADAIGLNFTASRRGISVETAREIVREVGNDVLTVGIFRDHLAREVIEIVHATGVGAAQLHGSETPITSHTVHAEVSILFRALAAGDPALDTVDDHGADVVLLDAPVPGGGVPFDWTLVGDLTSRHRVLLAGGLRPETVAAAVTTVGPWGVDVASGVESAPGRKDHDALRRFVANAREAARALPESTHPPLTPAEEPA